MPLAPGSRLGHYEIAAPLGAGGMGEVYRARDLRLDRVVAIKLVPDAFAADPERLARFEREARLLASLNHPHIATLHGLEADAERRFIVMELVEGESLAQRLERGPLVIEEALDVMRQVAGALETAHEGGVVHRDLKPANIMIARDGTAKVLDFGLAKGATGSPSDTALSLSPTVTVAATAGGVILGTAAYMSPEQARGRPVDRRTDIWAFGCVLYESLTGRQAFEGETISDLIASILKEKLDWAALPAGTPPRVRELLRRCLERDPRQRLRDIGEARLVLEQPSAGSASPGPGPGIAARGLPVRLAVGGAIALAALAGLSGWMIKPAPRPTTTWSHLVAPEGLRFHTAFGGNMALSDDGRWLATVAADTSGTRRILVSDFTTGGTRLLTGSEDATYPFWSPDARSLGAFKDGKLVQLDVEGGATTVIATAPEGRGGTWSRQGMIVFAPTANGGLSAVPASGGEVRVLVPDSLNLGYRFPHFLPDGRHFVCAHFDSNGGVVTEVHSLSGGPPRRLPLGSNTSGNIYYANGRLFYWQERALRSRRFDPGALTFSGDAVTVASDVAAAGPRARADIAVSASGAILYRRSLGLGSDQVVVRGRDGTILSRIEFNEALEDLQLSPDGRWLALSMRPIGSGQVDLWTYDLQRSAALRLTFAGQDDDAVWSPDGRRVAWQGPEGIRVKAASGAGSETVILKMPGDIMPGQWTADGRTVLFTSSSGQPGARGREAIWMVDAGGGVAREILGNPAYNARQGQLSPDGHWLAYSSNESRRYEVYVQDYPALRGRWQISTRSGGAPRWRRDGRELYFLDSDGRVMAARVDIRDSSLTVGNPAPLFETRMAAHGANRSFSWDVDATGSRFYNLEPRQQQVERQPMVVIRDWRPPSADGKR